MEKVDVACECGYKREIMYAFESKFPSVIIEDRGTGKELQYTDMQRLGHGDIHGLLATDKLRRLI